MLKPLNRKIADDLQDREAEQRIAAYFQMTRIANAIKGQTSGDVVPAITLDLTTAPSASNAFDGYGLATSRTVTDYNGRIVEIPADAVPMGGLRPVWNRINSSSDNQTGWTKSNVTTDSATLVTFLTQWSALRQIHKFAAGTKLVLSFRARRVSGNATLSITASQCVPSSLQITLTDSFRRYSSPELVANGLDSYFGIVEPNASGWGQIEITDWQLQDITPRADLSTAPDEFVSTDDDYGTGANGFRYFDTELANEVASNVVNEGTGASIDGWLDYQPGDTNYADCTHDFSGGADTITLTATGYYTLWLEGTAQVTIAAGTATITGAGSATEGSPVTINCTATGTVTLTLDNGTLDEWGAYQIIQLNDGTVPTAFIPSTGSASRPAMSPAPTISGLVGTEDARLTVKGLAADLVTPDPTDTTERTLDVDNTDGEFDTLPSPIKVLRIDVYNDGERPA